MKKLFAAMFIVASPISATEAAVLSAMTSGSIRSAISAPFSNDTNCDGVRSNPVMTAGGHTVDVTDNGSTTEFDTRVNYEFNLQDWRNQSNGQTVLQLSAANLFSVNANPSICILAYSGDGVLTPDDVQPSGSIVGSFVSPGDYPNQGASAARSFNFDISSFVNALPMGTDFLGIQFRVAHLAETRVDLTNVELTDVPEPAMLGLFGMSVIGLGLSRRRGIA